MLVAVRVVMGINEASTVLSGLHLQTGDYVMYTAATVLVAPNAVLLGGAYLLGPRVRGGHRHRASPQSLVPAGQLPGVPAAQRPARQRPDALLDDRLMAVPVLVAVLGAVMAQRAYAATSYDSAALRGFGGGLLAALLTTLVDLAGRGSIGTGRLADVAPRRPPCWWPPSPPMSVGGLVAGVVTAWLQRRRAARAAASAADE